MTNTCEHVPIACHVKRIRTDRMPRVVGINLRYEARVLTHDTRKYAQRLQ